MGDGTLVVSVPDSNPGRSRPLLRAERSADEYRHRRAPDHLVGDTSQERPRQAATALTAATVGLAFGQNSDITSEAAGAVILDTSLQKVDEFLHINRRLRSIALQSAVGGMVLSLIGMSVAALGYLPPVAGAIFQEVIDVVAVVNTLRVALPPKTLTDY